MIKFNYCGTHIKDEEYMNKMSAQGWNTKSLIEGFWNFEESQEKYTYRIYYFRGMNKKDINNKIKELEKNNIEFVSKYSFWGIFRSKKFFKLYNKEEQLEICNKIRKPMIVAIIICPLIIFLFIVLAKINKIFLLFTFLIFIYFLICLYLMIEYTKLITFLKNNNKNFK